MDYLCGQVSQFHVYSLCVNAYLSWCPNVFVIVGGSGIGAFSRHCEILQIPVDSSSGQCARWAPVICNTSCLVIL